MRQWEAVQRWYAPSFIFYHYLGAPTDRSGLYKMYRAFMFTFTSETVFKEVLITPGAGSGSEGSVNGGRAIVWLDQLVRWKFNPLPWSRPAVVPTLVVFHTAQMPDGRTVIAEQYDHISVYALVSAFPFAAWGFERLWRLLAGRVVAAVCGVADFAADMRKFVRLQLMSAPPTNLAQAGRMLGALQPATAMVSR